MVEDSIEIADRALSSFQVGERASFEKTFSTEDVWLFQSLSGDRNPLHSDASYAQTQQYKTRVLHGQLLAAPISMLAGHLLPGKRCLLLEVRSQFVRPAYPEDRLTYQGTVAQVSAAAGVVKVNVEVTNQNGEIVLRGTYDGKVR